MSATSSRILSRKLVFLYYYARLFNEDIIAHPLEEDEIKPASAAPSHEELEELTGWLGMNDEELAVEESSPAQPIKEMDDSTMQEDIDFIAHHQLPQHTNSQNTSYDQDFVMQLAAGYGIYHDLIAGLVAPYTDKFRYDEMSLTRRAILLLGYAEYKVLGTPASIVINECIELAKSYEDAAAGKLINGIMHQLMEVKEEMKTKEEDKVEK